MGQVIKVLDKGYVELVDNMGDDLRIVETARASTNAGTKGDEKDKKLIGYMAEHGHTSPFENVAIQFKMYLPLFVRSQLVRHRTAKINELSLRYVEAGDDFYFPAKWRAESKANKQSSVNTAELPHAGMNSILDGAVTHAKLHYKALRDLGAAKEMARMVIPTNLYVTWFYQMDLSNLFKLLDKRMAPDAQWETQEYARAMHTLARPLAPWAFEAWDEIRSRPAKMAQRLANLEAENRNLKQELEKLRKEK